jgi:hypothetical protein
MTYRSGCRPDTVKQPRLIALLSSQTASKLSGSYSVDLIVRYDISGSGELLRGLYDLPSYPAGDV